MSPDHDLQVERLFAAAIELAPDERRAYVTTHATSAEVRAEVLTLLDSHESRGSLDSIGDWLRDLGWAARSAEVEDLPARLGPGLGERYRVVREIARGGMAVVLLAQDLKHGREVALKVLRPTLAARIGTARFLQEISIAARLTHPHILPLHDSGETDGLLYYVMPYVDGESLRDRLQREERLALPEVLRIVRELADALSYAHEHGVIHRDIKPENVMFQAGHALVTDFGIARAMTEAGGRELRDTGVVLGTPAYMSPEQANADAAVDARSDVFALACVTYEMIAGHPPFTAGPLDRIRQQHAAAMIPPLTRERPDVPAALDAVIRSALAEQPEARPASAAEFVEALSHASGRAAKRTVRVALAAGVTVVLGVWAAVNVLRPASPVVPEASVIAVLPLASTAADPALERLGRDLVVTLSANLDGVGQIRAVDALTVLAQTRDAGVMDVEHGAALARRLGASSVAFGTIVRVDPDVRVDLGLFTADSVQPLARAVVTADANDLPALTDSLTWALLRAVWRARAPPTPNVTAVTTHSVPALRAFLEGEREGLEGRWDAAALSFERAMRADSTFWLAYWRYSYARWWYLEAVDDSVLAPLYENRFALPERDRLVLESWWTDTISVALARGREAVERYPDYWPGWMQYADWLFHVGPVAGYERDEARAALESTIALNPSFLPAWEHMYWLTIPQDTAAARRALDAMVRLGHDRSTIAEFGFDVTRVYGLELEFARSGWLDEPLTDSIVGDLLGPAHRRLGGGTSLPRVQVELSERVLAAEHRPQRAAVHESLLAEAWAARGAWDRAIAMAGRHARRVGADPLEAYRYAVIGAWLGAVSADTAARVRDDPARIVARPGASVMARAELAWLDGVLAVARADTNALARAREQVRASAAESSALLDRSLGAFAIGLAGDWKRAATLLAELNWDRPDVLAPGYDEHPYLIAVSRLAAARQYRELGDAPAALPLLMWFDAVWALDGYRPARRVFTAFAALERARTATLQSRSDLARRWYAEFLDRYDSPVPSHFDLLEEARRTAG